MKNLLKYCSLIALIGGLSTGQAAATVVKEGESLVRQVLPITATVHKKIEEAHKLMAQGSAAKADKALSDLLLDKRVNAYEQAVIWQLKAQIAYQNDDVKGTTEGYTQVLKRAKFIPRDLEMSVTYGLGQLYYAEGDYDQSLDYIGRWLKHTDPSRVEPTNLFFIASLHYVRDDFGQAASFAEQATAGHKAATGNLAPESWHQLKMSSFWEQKQYGDVEQTLMELLSINPNARYCDMLISLKTQQGLNPEESAAQVQHLSPTCAKLQQPTES